MLVQATKRWPAATVYAVFTGIRTTGTVVVEMVVFGKAKDWKQILFIGRILVAGVGLKLTS